MFAACDEQTPSETALRLASIEASHRPPPPLVIDGDGRALQVSQVFASTRIQTDDGDIVDAQLEGELSLEQRERTARPYKYVDEGILYASEAWMRGGDGSNVVESGYAVWAQENPTPLRPAPTVGPPVVHENVLEHVRAATGSEPLVLDLKLRDYPDSRIPLPPDVFNQSPADVQEGMRRRELARLEREAFFDERTEELVADIETLGGRVLTRWWNEGWLSVEVPFGAFEVISQRSDLARIDAAYGKVGGAQWPLGEGRTAEYLGAEQFIDAGWDGGEPNAARHGYGRIAVAITENGGYETGACGFRDGWSCTSATRIASGRTCNNGSSNPCQIGNLHTNTTSDNHGTAVAAVVLADYRQGQANGAQVGDGAWVSNTCTSSADCGGQACECNGTWCNLGEVGKCSHSATWENDATGMAPEAKAVLFGLPDTSSFSNRQASLADMFVDAAALNVDITNSSWLWSSQTCNLESSSVLEDAIENAFDDGILPVFSAGNFDGDDATSCTLIDPAALPKAFVVNAYDADTNDCEGQPATRCLLDRDSCWDQDTMTVKGCSSRGGASVKVAGHGSTPIADAVTNIDLVAPNDISSMTWQGTGTQGVVGGSFVGTSAAAPHVAGLAAVVKDWLLDKGQGWINDPGYLHVMLMAMTDRHFSATPSSGTTWTSQLFATPSKWYGLGRAKMRVFENGFGLGNWGLWVGNLTLTGAGTITFNPFGTAGLPSGVELLKCTTLQIEDMSGSTTDVSELKLSLYVRPNAGSSCTGTSVYSRISNHFDLRKVAALWGGTYTNRCAEVQLQWENVTSRGLNTKTACYYAGVMDDDDV